MFSFSRLSKLMIRTTTNKNAIPLAISRSRTTLSSSLYHPRYSILRINHNNNSCNRANSTNSKSNSNSNVMRKSSSFATTAIDSDENKKSKSALNFSDGETSFKSKSTPSLILSYSVFTLCMFGPLVRNADRLIALSYFLLGRTLTDTVVKATFFKQFCGGETPDDLRPTIQMLEQSGINGILDYAAENAPDEETELDPPNQPARTFMYQNEEQCDHHVDIFKACVKAVKDVTPNGFAALKITALGDPILLERMSKCINECYKLMKEFDTNKNGIITVADFELNYHKFFVDAKTRLPGLIKRLDPNNSGQIDYIEWSKMVQPEDVPRLVKSVRESGRLSHCAPTPEDLVALANAKRRLDEVAQVAFDNEVRLLIDAEQTWFQPAIDNFTLELMKKYNDKTKTDVPIIFNTYQCYLKNTPGRISKDIKFGHRNGFHFAAKLVRGAYMTAERARAEDSGVKSPIHDTIQDTHDCYNSTVEYLFDARKNAGNIVVGDDKNGRNNNDAAAAADACEVMLGSHNQESIEKAIEYIETHCDGDGNRVGAHFAQLLGMRDNLTFALGEGGYNAYKYVPYGLVGEVLPYLIRRAQENSNVTEGMSEELDMIKGELKRRLIG